MLKRLIASVILIMGASQVEAQSFPSQQWYIGEVRFSDNTFSTGQVKYDLEHDVVQLRSGDRIQTYSPTQVTSFSIRPQPNRRNRDKKQPVINRYFFSVPFVNDAGYKRPRFFEVVVEGKATLLAREYIATVTTNAGRNSGLRRNRLNQGQLGGANSLPRTRTVLAHKMYLASLDGSVKELPTKRKDLLFLFKEHQSSLKQFMKKERIKTDELFDMARFFNHYNALSNQQSKVD